MSRTELDVALRRARPSDARAVAEVHVASWKAAYPGLIPQDYLDGLRAEDRLDIWQQALAADTWPRLLVAEEGSHMMGFVCVGPSRDPGADPDTVGEVQALYLHPHAFGRGVGRQLMNGALDELRQAGFTQATLWVLDTNARARKFYEGRGWTHDGTDKYHDWTAFTATDLRYRISLP